MQTKVYNLRVIRVIGKFKRIIRSETVELITNLNVL